VSAAQWLHLVVLLQLPGAASGWLAARSVYRRRDRVGVSDNRISAVHQTGRDMLRTRARLAGWVEARQRGVTPAVCDAITDAALAGVIELLEQWERGE